MRHPNDDEWGFQEIAAKCPDRASKLADAGSPEALIEALNEALCKALTQDVRVGFDGIDGDLGAPRVAIQFPVPVELFDWFFNGRTGYRAQYWVSPENGQAFNARLLCRLRRTIDRWAPAGNVEGRAIKVVMHNGCREDFDDGALTISRAVVMASLDPRLSKIWRCERLIQHDGIKPKPMLSGTTCPELCIPRWHGVGLLAPFPDEGEAWLDIKGGYVRDGEVGQPKKPPSERAKSIHFTGWT